LYLSQIPTVKDVIAGGDAIQGWPIWLVILLIFFFVVITGVVVAIIVYRGLAKTQNDTNALLAKVLDKSNDNSTIYAGAIAVLAHSVATQQAEDKERDKASAKRDEAITLISTGLAEQNAILNSGNELTRKLTATFTESVSDTTTAVGAVGETITTQINDMQVKLSNLIASIPGVVSEQTINSYSSMKQSFNELSKVFTPILQENQDLKTTLELREDTIKSLNALNLTLQAKLDDCQPPDKVVGYIAPPESEEKPTNETSGSVAA